MPLVAMIILAGLIGSAILGVVVGTGWVALCYKAYAAKHPEDAYLYDHRLDFGQAWGLTFFSGLAMTAAGIAIAWKMGVDIGRMIG